MNRRIGAYTALSLCLSAAACGTAPPLAPQPLVRDMPPVAPDRKPPPNRIEFNLGGWHYSCGIIADKKSEGALKRVVEKTKPHSDDKSIVVSIEETRSVSFRFEIDQNLIVGSASGPNLSVYRNSEPVEPAPALVAITVANGIMSDCTGREAYYENNGALTDFAVSTAITNVQLEKDRNLIKSVSTAYTAAILDSLTRVVNQKEMPPAIIIPPPPQPR
jgi:hypothetical protein